MNCEGRQLLIMSSFMFVLCSDWKTQRAGEKWDRVVSLWTHFNDVHRARGSDWRRENEVALERARPASVVSAEPSLSLSRAYLCVIQ